MGERLRFVSWAAVSSLPQAKKISLEEQKRINREHIERWGGVEIECLEVPGESRSIVLWEDACRRIPAYQRLRELLDAAAFDVLIFLDRSRLGRKASLSMAVVELCRDAGIGIYETESPPSTVDDIRGKASYDEQILGAFKSVGAQREIEKLQERKRQGMIGRARKGLPPGLPRFGYRWEQYGPRREERRIVQVPEQIETVLLVYELYLDQGMGIPSIQKALGEAGRLTPGGNAQWNAATVYNIIVSCWIYAGYVDYNRKSATGLPFMRYPAIWEAVISEDRAREIDEERERRATNRRSLHNRRYSRVLVCGACGSHMIVAGTKLSRQTGERLVYYRCADKCKGSFIGERVLDDELGQELAAIARDGIDGYLSDDDGTERLLQQVQDDLVKLERQASDVAEERIRLARLTVRGSLSEEEYDILLAEIEKRTDQVERKRGELQQRRIELQDSTKRALRLEDVAAAGPEILKERNVRTFNAWLRRHVRLYVAKNHVTLVEWI